MIRTFVTGVAISGAIAGIAAAQEIRLTKPAVRLAHQFSGINGFRELSDGRVLVADGIDDAVLRVDLATGKIDTVGRAGPGPGEYKSPDGLFALPAGATLLVDLGNARMSVIDAAGKHRESFPIAQGQPGAGPGPVPLVFPRGTDSRGRIYYQPVGGGDSGVVVRWDRAAARFDTVGRVKLPPLVTKTSGGPNNRNVRQQPAPYPTQDSWAVAPDGRVAFIRAPVYRVDWVPATGSKPSLGKPIAATPVPVRAAEKKEYLAEVAANGLSVSIENNNGQVSMRFARGRREDDDEPEPDGMEWPETKPVFTGATAVGPDGRLWVERSVGAGAARGYDLIGPAGEVVGRVVAPVGRRLVGVGTKGVYLRHVDADGVSYLERYDLP